MGRLRPRDVKSGFPSKVKCHASQFTNHPIELWIVQMLTVTVEVQEEAMAKAVRSQACHAV